MKNQGRAQGGRGLPILDKCGQASLIKLSQCVKSHNNLQSRGRHTPAAAVDGVTEECVCAWMQASKLLGVVAFGENSSQRVPIFIRRSPGASSGISSSGCKCLHTNSLSFCTKLGLKFDAKCHRCLSKLGILSPPRQVHMTG